MKATKFLILVGGLLGLLAFFFPLVTVEVDGHSVSVTSFQVMKGLGGTLNEVKGIVIAIFAPAALLALLGGLGVARRRFGRVAGAFSLIAGIAGLGIAAILKGAAEGDAGFGMSMLMFTGAAGIIGGMIALAKPEPGAPKPIPQTRPFAAVPAAA